MCSICTSTVACPSQVTWMSLSMSLCTFSLFSVSTGKLLSNSYTKQQKFIIYQRTSQLFIIKIIRLIARLLMVIQSDLINSNYHEFLVELYRNKIYQQWQNQTVAKCTWKSFWQMEVLTEIYCQVSNTGIFGYCDSKAYFYP